MFSTKEQLKSAMKEILETFQQGDDFQVISSKYSDGTEADLVEAINACISHRYLTGVYCSVDPHGDVVISTPEPHVTAAGNEFISEN